MAAKQLFMLVLALICILTVRSHFCEAQNATDRIKPGETLRYSDRMLVSKDGRFQLGFFNVSYSSKKFMGIRYAAKDRSVTPWIWVANREAPVYNTSDTALKMDENGLLQIVTSGENNNKSSIFQLNPNRASPESITVLENSGNLVVKESNPDGKILWQSFDHPTDTLLPGVKLGSRSNGPGLVSWLSESNPGPGPFTLEYDPSEPSFIVKRRGNPYSRHGPGLVDDWSDAELSFVKNGTESFFSYSSKNGSGLFLRLDTEGQISYGDLSSYSTRMEGCNAGVAYSSSCAAGPDAGECRAGKEDVFVARQLTILSNSSRSSVWIEDDQTLVRSDCLDRCWRNCTCIAFEALYADETG